MSEMRRGEAVFVLGDLESDDECHATPRHGVCHAIASGRSSSVDEKVISQRTENHTFLFLHDHIIYFR